MLQLSESSLESLCLSLYNDIPRERGDSKQEHGEEHEADCANRAVFFQLKQYVEKNSFILVEREASRRFMASRGMSMDMLTNVILSLEPEDCFDGPEADRDPRFAKKWTVAEFSPMFRGEQLYLKMSIRVDAERAKCLSVKAYIEKRDTDD